MQDVSKDVKMKEKRYKEPIKEELETTINVLYNENKLVIYTNKVK